MSLPDHSSTSNCLPSYPITPPMSTCFVLTLQIIEDNIDLRPGCIIRDLQLKRPIYQKTASYGHFGRPQEPNFSECSSGTISGFLGVPGHLYGDERGAFFILFNLLLTPMFVTSFFAAWEHAKVLKH